LRADPRRIIAIALAALLVVGVGIAIGSQVVDRLTPPATSVTGLIGSEKLAFFRDPRVIAALRRGGFEVSVSTAGSRQIASADLTEQDFVFPAGVPAAEKVRRDHGGTTSVVPFYTPMAIATWRPIVDLLTQAGVIQQRNGYLAFDVAAYLALVANDTRWKDLPNNKVYAANKSILVNTTDVRTSNSAAMWLAIVSYVQNNNNVVELGPQLEGITEHLSPLFLRQGFSESSTESAFDDYLTQGIGKAPLLMIYESQFLERAAADDGAVTPDMVLAYPEPTIFSKHTLVSLTPDGQRFGQFLSTDSELRGLATEHGFRTSDAQAFHDFVAEHQLNAPESIVDVIEPPTFETMEGMITTLESIFTGDLQLEPPQTPTPEPTDTPEPTETPTS